MVASRNDRARLRGLCAEKGFELEPALSGSFRLIFLGHAVKHPNGKTTFSAKQAISYLKSFEEERA
jgi:hypothetical protein